MLKPFSLMAGVISCLGIGWLAYQKLWEAIITVVVTSIATVGAAYFGAKVAFDKNAEKERENIRNQNRINGNIALFNLMHMINLLGSFRLQFIDPWRTNDHAFLLILPALPFEKIKLNVEALSFLLETDEPNLLGELALSEEAYRNAVGSINERSRLHRDDVQPKLEQAGFIQGQHNANQAADLLGNRLNQTLKLATDTMIKVVDETIDRLKINTERLGKCLKTHFPEGKTIHVEFPAKNETTAKL